MDRAAAVELLIERFPFVKERVDRLDELFEMVHVSYSLLATEVLEHSEDDALLTKVAAFVDELAGSGDDFLEELLVIDVLEGIAQDPGIADRLEKKISSKASSFLARVEREYYGRHR